MEWRRIGPARPSETAGLDDTLSTGLRLARHRCTAVAPPVWWPARRSSSLKGLGAHTRRCTLNESCPATPRPRPPRPPFTRKLRRLDSLRGPLGPSRCPRVIIGLCRRDAKSQSRPAEERRRGNSETVPARLAARQLDTRVMHNPPCCIRDSNLARETTTLLHGSSAWAIKPARYAGGKS